MTANAAGSSVVGLVMVGDDQIDAELARPARRIGAADPAVHRHDERDAVRVQPFDRRRLQPVAVADALRNEVHDVGAEQLERPAQNHRGRDAVDVVVAVDRDPLLARDGGHDAIDRDAHVGEPHRIVELVERRVQKARGELRVAEPALTQKPGDGRIDAERAGQPDRRRLVTREHLPARSNRRHQDRLGGPPAPSFAGPLPRDAMAGGAHEPSSTKSIPSRPMFRNF